MTIHVVRSGETVYSIARQYGVSPHRLAQDNGVENGLLAVGQTLVIRFPRQIHSVRLGETLYSIAQQHGISVRTLLQNNFSLHGGDRIYPGQGLVLSYFGRRLGSALFSSYAYPFISDDLLRQELPYLTCFAPFTYGIATDGTLLPLEDSTMLSLSRQAGTRTVMHLSTLTESGQFSTQRAENLLQDQEATQLLVEQILQTMQEKGFSGLDVDFEYLPADLAQAYADFLSHLRQLLNPMGKFLWAALAPKNNAQQRGLLYEGHSYGAVGAAADAVLLMTYEWGYTYGPPMAVAPIESVRAVLNYAVTEIPPTKILLGLPNYGYDWPLPFVQGVTRAASISNQQAIQLAIQHRIAIQYDESAQSPFFHYTDENGTVHEVWFEDARSLTAKLQLIAECGFLGAGIWNLMRPFPQLWQVISALYDIL